MSNPSQPVGQLAYQSVFVTKFANAVRCFQQTANRYGGGSAAFQGGAGSINACDAFPVGRTKGRAFYLGGTQVATGFTGAISSSGGAGYVANDVVTFSPLNGGRSIVIKVNHVTAGNPDSITVLDQGGGGVGGGSGVSNPSTTPSNLVLTQLSTTGVGVPGTWTWLGSFIPFGWVFPQPNPST